MLLVTFILFYLELLFFSFLRLLFFSVSMNLLLSHLYWMFHEILAYLSVKFCIAIAVKEIYFYELFKVVSLFLVCMSWEYVELVTQN